MDTATVHSPARPRVLVLDNEVVVADTVVSILKLNGFDAFPAYRGTEAVRLAAELSPDVLITGVLMPDANGIDVGASVAKLVPHCRVVLFSGRMESADLAKEMHSRGQDFEIVGKPIRPADLLAQLGRLLKYPPARVGVAVPLMHRHQSG